MEQRKVEVVNKLTEAQIRDAKVFEIEERLEAQENHILELRAQMIEIRKELVKSGKKSDPKKEEKS